MGHCLWPYSIKSKRTHQNCTWSLYLSLTHSTHHLHMSNIITLWIPTQRQQHTYLICRKWVECQAPILRQELRGGMDKHCTCGVLCICRVSERDGGFDNLWCATKFHPCIISFLFALGWYQNLQIHQYLPPCLQEEPSNPEEDAWCKCSESLFYNARNILSQSNPGTRDEKVY